jgi:5'-nucleotidase
LSSPSTRRWGRGGVAAVCVTLVATPLALMPTAEAATDGSNVVINEVYGAGGNSGAAFNTDYVELYNPTDTAIKLSGWSVQYRSATGTGNPSGVIGLTGYIGPHDHFLVGGATGANGAPIPEPDSANSGVNLSGTTGTVFLASQSAALTAPATGSITPSGSIVDVVGFGGSNTYEGTDKAIAPSTVKSISRVTEGVDTNDNKADFASTDGTATVSTYVLPDVCADDVTIAELQGEGAESPCAAADEVVTTSGVVTAAYPTGGFNGFYLQTPGTGGAVDLDTHTASDAVFVYLGSGVDPVDYPAVGTNVEVTGRVSEFGGLTEVSVDDLKKDLQILPQAADPVAPVNLYLPGSEAARESLEGMLVDPKGRYTVSDNYALNQYAEIGLARGSKPLLQPTDVALPGSDEADAVADRNTARAVTLDDGATANFFSSSNQDTPLPYLSPENPVRVGAPASFTKPVVIDYRNGAWKFQPTSQLTAANAADVQPATFANTRTAKPEPVGGDLKIASFNVLNYFTETGADWERDGGSCDYYTDRDNNVVTVDDCGAEGPRGAANTVNLLRQQEKIVAAINSLGADVLSLEEIENSAKYPSEADGRDHALATLVEALNADLGRDAWAFVPSPGPRPAVADEDVIRTAFIYKKDSAETVGTSKILTGSPAFGNAREPLAQVFRPAGGTLNQQFVVIVNHFKSKGSGVDDGTGQGNANPDRVNQAKALVAFAQKVQADTDTKQVFLTGDFNSYTQEDPMRVLYDAGYTDIGSRKTDESTYLFDGLVGSLDHVLANSAGYAQVAGADVWNINSVEPVALEYSRYNYNATDFYAPNAFRSSDHDPLVVGINSPTRKNEVMLNLLNINDFHGRIDTNTTKFATTVEQLRDGAGDKNTLFMSAGDNMGASLFPSSSADDNPTIDVLNALDMNSSAVGNHEFDKGFGDLTDHIMARAEWKYIGANVLFKDDHTHALPTYKVTNVDGVRVGVIGAVTEETPSLVAPAGITALEFGEMVNTVNEVADQLTDGDEENGEADVLVAEYHEGSGLGTADGADLASQVAKGGAFADIVQNTSPKVDAIFTGHTHKQYAWDAPIPGDEAHTRPILQTGQYGENVGQIKLFVDPTTGAVNTYTVRNVARSATVEVGYPRVAAVKQIVDKAIADADVIGGQPVGEITGTISRAFKSGSFVDGIYTGGSVANGGEDRSSESSIGDLVAQVMLDSLSDPDRGGAEIGVVNPGGLREDLAYAGVSDTNGDGVITYAEANAVLPFVNNLWTIDLTGAQFKSVLEQQWQRDAAGNIPTRAFLHLGLSDNVSVTLDETRPEGDRVTSVLVDGEPLDMTRTYRIGTVSFLAQGGDNFWAFKDGTNVKDSGLVDRDAWISYLTENSPVAPQFDRRQVYTEGLPAEVHGGDALAFTLTHLDVHSNGAPENTGVTAVLRTTSGDTPLGGTFPVTDGTAEVSFTVPADAPAGSSIVVTAAPSGTAVTVPVLEQSTQPEGKVTPTMHVRLKQDVVHVDRTRPTLVVTLRAPEMTVRGRVQVVRHGHVLAHGRLDDGRVRLRLPAFSARGDKVVRVKYLGNSHTNPVTERFTIRVVR